MPRGCLESVLKALKAERFNPVLTDRRYAGVPLDATFRGELRLGQKLAVSELRKSDTGILAAGTAFGKTVVAASLIAERKVNTLVLVNCRQLQMQWVAQLSSFLGIPERDIGRIGAGTGRWTGKVDLLAEKSRLAIRLDAMADVADAEAYRRARREDALLQRKGYRIVRFLAEDVCTRLDATLDALQAWMSC